MIPIFPSVMAALSIFSEPVTEAVTIIRAGSQPAEKASTDHFSGEAFSLSRFSGEGDSRLIGSIVAFSPGGRTHWHTHPVGQTLIVTDGVGWVGVWNGPRHEMRTGDILRIPAGVKHWHGGTATSEVRHIALVETRDGIAADWLEPVSEGQYGADPMEDEDD